MPRATKVRYDRMGALLVSTGVTVFALLAGVGTFGPLASAAGSDAGDQQRDQARAAARPATGQARARTRNAAQVNPQWRLSGTGVSAPAKAEVASPTARSADDPDGSEVDAAVPAGSGRGRRVVFDMSKQRVWLVGDNGSVITTYLVSGSLTDNLGPGAYKVYSRSLHAVGVDDSGTMEYFVRFTRGQNAAIGFHDIPIKDGRTVQTPSQLGTPQSHGCIRQERPDAIALWNFAPIGTPVDVVA